MPNALSVSQNDAMATNKLTFKYANALILTQNFVDWVIKVLVWVERLSKLLEKLDACLLSMCYVGIRAILQADFCLCFKCSCFASNSWYCTSALYFLHFRLFLSPKFKRTNPVPARPLLSDEFDPGNQVSSGLRGNRWVSENVIGRYMCNLPGRYLWWGRGQTSRNLFALFW